VTDEQASTLGKKWIDLLADREQLRGKYYDKFVKVLSPAQAFKVMQIERRLELLIDMQIAKELPMLQ
jgi:hypothetical protein